MKKTLLVIVMAFIGQQSMGQVQAGSIFVTGIGSIYSESGESSMTNGGVTLTMDEDKKSGGEFGLGGGYFLSDNIAVGIGFNVMGEKMTPADTADAVERSRGFGVGIFGRYYVPISDNFYFFGQVGLGFGSESSKETKDGVDTDGPKKLTTTFGIRPGFTFFPTETFGFDLTFGNIGWEGTTETEEAGPITTEKKMSNMDFSFDLTTITFGIQYFFGQ